MELRKIQKTGGNTYIVSLPAKWVREQGLQKNTPVGVIPRADGTLLITTKPEGKVAAARKEFKVDDNVDENLLFRSLIAAYIVGFSEVKVYSERGLNSRIRRVVREFSSMVIGQEVTDEDPISITVKDLLDPLEMPFEKSIERMHIIVKSMIDDAELYLSVGDEATLEDIVARDNYVDRLNWLISRQSVMALKDPTFVEKMGVSSVTAVIYSFVGKHIERVGDHAVRIAKNLAKVRHRVNNRVSKEIKEALHSAERLFDGAIESLIKGDMSLANEVIESVGETHRRCEELIHALQGGNAEDLLYIGNISDSIRRIGDYSADICESVLNLLVSEAVTCSLSGEDD
ncbi:MAG: phosphate uptake regulator PhoU [Thermoplasmata archaeon]|nr:MAG: phosphate uptake regulator PhoU [Thermoplasmata archaeon]